MCHERARSRRPRAAARARRRTRRRAARSRRAHRACRRWLQSPLATKATRRPRPAAAARDRPRRARGGSRSGRNESDSSTSGLAARPVEEAHRHEHAVVEQPGVERGPTVAAIAGMPVALRGLVEDRGRELGVARARRSSRCGRANCAEVARQARRRVDDEARRACTGACGDMMTTVVGVEAREQRRARARIASADARVTSARAPPTSGTMIGGCGAMMPNVSEAHASPPR